MKFSRAIRLLLGRLRYRSGRQRPSSKQLVVTQLAPSSAVHYIQNLQSTLGKTVGPSPRAKIEAALEPGE